MKSLLLAALLLPFALPAHADGPGRPHSLSCAPVDGPNVDRNNRYGLDVRTVVMGPHYVVSSILLVEQQANPIIRPYAPDPGPQKWVLGEISQDAASAVFGLDIPEKPRLEVRYDKRNDSATIARFGRIIQTCLQLE